MIVFFILLLCCCCNGPTFLFSNPDEKDFCGYECQTSDCSGHMAGYLWASKYDYYTYSQCIGGNSNSFREGCRAYVDGCD